MSVVEQHLFVLPLRLGGLGIGNPVALASHLFNLSVGGTKYLVIDLLLVLSLLN